MSGKGTHDISDYVRLSFLLFCLLRTNTSTNIVFLTHISPSLAAPSSTHTHTTQTHTTHHTHIHTPPTHTPTHHTHTHTLAHTHTHTQNHTHTHTTHTHTPHTHRTTHTHTTHTHTHSTHYKPEAPSQNRKGWCNADTHSLFQTRSLHRVSWQSLLLAYMRLSGRCGPD